METHLRKLEFTILSLFYIIILGWGTATYAIEHGLPVAEPEKVGVSSEVLGKIAPTLQGYVDKGQLPGFLTVIARKGKIVHIEPIGMQDIENKKPIKTDTIFRIYSMSKPITSVAVMILYDAGRIKLDDPVEKYIPVFKDLKVFNNQQTKSHTAKNKMTIKHLLTHTSGLTYGWGDRPVDKLYNKLKVFDSDSTLAEKVETLSKIPLVFEPGKRWKYGVSTDVLGYLVEVVSEMPYEEFLKKKLFKPIGMADAGFSVPPSKVERFASIYRATEAGGLNPVQKPPLATDNVTFFPSGGGGLVSTAADYLRFCQMLLNGGELDGVRILKTETVELMHYPHQKYHRDGWSYGFGFHVVTRKNQRSTGTFSGGGLAGTSFWIDPEKELIGILMTQILKNQYPFQREFLKFAYKALTDSE